jgi:hypothetical protein
VIEAARELFDFLEGSDLFLRYKDEGPPAFACEQTRSSGLWFQARSGTSMAVVS